MAPSPEAGAPPFRLQIPPSWALAAWVYLLLTLATGVILRYQWTGHASVPVDARHLLHAHSQIGLLGWAFVALFGSLLTRMGAGLSAAVRWPLEVGVHLPMAVGVVPSALPRMTGILPGEGVTWAGWGGSLLCLRPRGGWGTALFLAGAWAMILSLLGAGILSLGGSVVLWPSQWMLTWAGGVTLAGAFLLRPRLDFRPRGAPASTPGKGGREGPGPR